jgi:hypothetical protein
MLKVFASLVIGFFVVLWVTGNNPSSLREEMVHWADGNPSTTGAGYSSDWGQ